MYCTVFNLHDAGGTPPPRTSRYVPPESNSCHLTHLETISISSGVNLADRLSSISSTVTQGSEHVYHRERDDLLPDGRVTSLTFYSVFFEVRHFFWNVFSFLLD